MNALLLFLLKQTDYDKAYDAGLKLGHFIRDYGLLAAVFLLLVAIALIFLIKKYRKT